MKKLDLKILLVEDNPGDARLILEMLNEDSKSTYNISTVASVSNAVSSLADNNYDIIILDLNLPDSTGLETLDLILKKSGKTIPVIVLTGLDDENTGISSIEHGAEDYLVKGVVNTQQMLKTIRYGIERKKLDLELLYSEERFRKLHESMIDAFVEVDMQGRILSCNSTYMKMLGYNSDELSCLTYKDLTPEKWHSIEMDIIENQILKNGYSEIYEKEYRRKDGIIFPVELRTSLLTDSSGNPSGMWAIVRDVTLQKQAQNELLLRSSAMENAANAIVITDIAGTILWANQAFEKLTLYPLSDAVGYNPRDIIKSGMHDKEFYKNIWKTILSGNVWKGEIVNKKKDGSLYTEEMTIAPVKNTEGKISNFVAIKQDITDRNFALDLLKTRLNLINYSAEHSLNELLIKTLDEVERITGSTISFFSLINEDQTTLSIQAWSTGTSGACYMADGKDVHYNITDAGVWGDSVRERKPVVHNDYQSLSDKKGLPGGHVPLTRELVIPITRNYKIVAIIGVGNKSKDYSESDISVVTYLADIAWDIVEKKRDEDHLKQFNAELEMMVENRTFELKKINKELESFTYSVSHDLRAPLRHIMGFIDRLNSDPSVEKKQHYMDVINESAKRMYQLIDDLLSYSRMGRAAFSEQNVNMEMLLKEVLYEYSGELEAGKVSVVKHNLPDVKGDRAMIRVVLVNLFSNAVKFSGKTAHPIIEIGYKMVDGENVFYIRDNGAGYDMKYADKLFGVFQRLHSEREFSGTGIGLAMVKNIIERHKGRIWAESEPGSGACFYFTLPDLDLTGK